MQLSPHVFTILCAFNINVAVPLPVLNTEINIMCNPFLSIPLNVRTYSKNCAKRKDELQRMAKLKQQLKMNNHRCRRLCNLKQALQRKAKIESNLHSKIRDLKLKFTKIYS